MKILEKMNNDPLTTPMRNDGKVLNIKLLQ